MELNPAARATFDAMREGITIIDTEGRLVFCNRAYLDFLRKELGEPLGSVEGKYLRDLRPGARLPDVLEAGKPILHITRQETKDFYFVNLYPIYEGDTPGGRAQRGHLSGGRLPDQRGAGGGGGPSRQALHSISKANGARYTFDDIVAVTPAVARVKDLAQRIAVTDATVLLESESGTGKELYAQAIHNASSRRDGVFVAINCSNFNANMLESELFGYAEGAFTGAKRGGKMGLFEAAAGGTLFLDEISEMDVGLQAKLLRVLQEHVHPPGGGHQGGGGGRAGSGRLQRRPARLCGRRQIPQGPVLPLSTFPLHIPPLRERPGDIPALAQAILEDFSHKLRRPFRLTEDAVTCLQAHSWPGNVRELRNVLEFSAYLTPSGVINQEALPSDLVHQQEDVGLTLAQRTRAFEKRVILNLLEQNGSSLEGKKRTAAQLGISLASLYNKLKD